jgi:hypothetical protein
MGGPLESESVEALEQRSNDYFDDGASRVTRWTPP